MTIRELIRILSMFPEQLDVYVQTNPSDYMAPLQMQNISLMMARNDERDGFQQSHVTITAFLPSKS